MCYSSLGHSCSGATENGGWTVAFGLTAACQTGSGIMEKLAWHDSTLSRMACQGLDSRLERVSPIVMMDPFPNWSILEYLMVSCRLSGASSTSCLAKKRPLLMAFLFQLFTVNLLSLRKPKKATAKAACSMRRSWVECVLLTYRDWDNSFNILMVSGCLPAVPYQA